MSGDRVTFEYVVLRYMHDITSGEFINVGVIASSKDGQQLKFRFRTTYTRLKGAFPTLDGDSFRMRMRSLKSFYLNVLRGDLGMDAIHELESSKLSVLDYAHLAIPPDDSSLQWSPVGSGLTRNLHATTEKLFDRFVSAHDAEHTRERKKDEDVWHLFSSVLERKNLTRNLTEKTIEVADDSIKFEHAWKNGKWHCFEPLSFDLASQDSIKGKAHRWLGKLSSVQSANEKFAVYFLVGKPSDGQSEEAYAGALNILRKSDNATVIEEGEAEDFGDRIAAQMMRHTQAPI